jgi:transposase InsO family protein
VLSHAGSLSKWNGKPSKKGTGFAQPLAAHQHWHIDVSYLNIGVTFYYLCSILDGFSRYIVNWDVRTSMTEADIEIILQGANEKHHEARPRIISDNGPQFIAKDFKEFIRIGAWRTCAPRRSMRNRTGRSNAGTNHSKGVHQSRNAAIARRCTASGKRIRRPLQQRPPEQRHGLHYSEGHVGGAAAGSMRSATGDWRRRRSNGRFVAEQSRISQARSQQWTSHSCKV